MCDSHDLAIQDCLAHKNTTIVFSGTWRNHDIVFKTKREPHHFEDLTALIDAGHGGKITLLKAFKELSHLKNSDKLLNSPFK